MREVGTAHLAGVSPRGMPSTGRHERGFEWRACRHKGRKRGSNVVSYRRPQEWSAGGKYMSEEVSDRVQREV